MDSGSRKKSFVFFNTKKIMTNNHYAITGRLTCTSLTTQDVGEQLQIDTIPNISFFKKAMHIFTPVGMMKGAQSSTSNISLFNAEESGSWGGWSHVVDCKRMEKRSSRLLKTFSLEPPTACGNWTISRKAVLSLCPSSLLGNHPSSLGVKERATGTSLYITPKEEGKLS